jgi:hypothetical protein
LDHTNPQSQKKKRSPWRFGDVSPSPAAHEELIWFFNEAESAIEQPSNYCAALAGLPPTSLAEAERRVEALHAANKIKARLQAIPGSDALLLAGLYTPRPWSRRVEKVLGALAGALVVSASFRAEYLRALVRARTKADSVAQWLEELVKTGGAKAVGAWRIDIERACAIAVRAYERVRGDGPSVVPDEERTATRDEASR